MNRLFITAFLIIFVCGVFGCKGVTITETEEEHVKDLLVSNIPVHSSPNDAQEAASCFIVSLTFQDSEGNPLDSVTNGTPVVVNSNLRNTMSSATSYVNVVQIQDRDGVTVFINWKSGQLGAGESTDVKISWTPASAGSYTVSSYVWTSLDNPKQLALPTTADIDVM